MSKFQWGMRACALSLLWVTAAVALPAQTFTTLHSFDNTDGANSEEAALVQATNGNLYGTTTNGGANANGTVFKITPGGTLATLYNFCSQSGCTDGANPKAGLIQATNGNLYGTTYGGGANGLGTVFKITTNGALTTLHSFDGTDGSAPIAGLVQATNGALYGATYTGGTGSNGYGTIFKITPGGTLTTLYNFCSQSGCADGADPSAALVQATNGIFYGITAGGGTTGYGTVFKITPGGTLTTLYSFCSQNLCADGADGFGGLVQATDGTFYGTTYQGGTTQNGTVFKITPSGTLTTLHSFDVTDGQYPLAALVQATNGKFYGTASGGGANSNGTVFEITANGTLTTLHSFDVTDGQVPLAALVRDTNGKFYGTAYIGGANGYGTVFSLSIGLGPFVETQTTSGKVGAAVKILGTNLIGATSVTFNGTAATFTVVSSSEITTTVPTGATSGTVQVVTPGGTLSSNVPFTVKP